MFQVWVYCTDTAPGVRFFFPFIGNNIEDCLARILDREILKPGEIITRIESLFNPVTRNPRRMISMNAPIVSLVFLTPNNAWVFLFGDALLRLPEHPMFFASKRDALAAASAVGLTL